MTYPLHNPRKTRTGFVLMLSALYLILWVNAWSDDHEKPTPNAFGPEIFRQRRAALLDSLGDGMAVLSSDGTFGEMGYRAAGDFWYLTGLDDPGAILILAPKEKYRTVLLLAPRDQEQEGWVGERAALTESLKVALQVDQVNRTSDLDWWLMSRIGHSRTLHLISRPALPSAEIPPDMVLYNKITDRMPEVTVCDILPLLTPVYHKRP